ncbi:MAG: DsbA family protein [Candidatus Wildermuthbacteria bacterium]|nr:DsbA family protein [Candidatus Wildermuthbacteria bacterium]
MKTQTLPWIIMLAIVGGAIGIVTLAVTGNKGGELSPVAIQLGPDEIWKGKEDARVTLVEYADFQCPACSTYAPLVGKIAEEFKDEVRVVFRHFPLRQIHSNADEASRAAHAAFLQGRFWEMHDRLFQEQRAWSASKDPTGLFDAYARDLGLNEEQFKNDISSDATRAKIEADVQSGFQARVPGTPTFFLQGRMMQNPKNYEDFRSRIQTALGQDS